MEFSAWTQLDLRQVLPIVKNINLNWPRESDILTLNNLKIA